MDKKKSRLTLWAIIPFVIGLVLGSMVSLGVNLSKSKKPSHHVAEVTTTEAVTEEVTEKPREELTTEVADLEPEQVEMTISHNDTTPVAKENTILIYMVGSNLESEAGAETLDLQEMVNSGVDLSKTNIVIYAGGAKRWAIRMSAGKNHVIRIIDNNLYEVGNTEAKDMAASLTLAEFLQYGDTYYPAENMSLILWDHGGNMGFGYDELYQDYMFLDKIRKALISSPFNSEHKLKWIGCDTCLNATVEFASVFKDYADYYIASQESESGTGWDYSFLSAYNTSSDPAEIGTKLANRYDEIESTKGYGYTLSVMDLSKTDDLLKSVDDCMKDMTDSLDEEGYNSLVQNGKNQLAFGVQAGKSKKDGMDLVDLGVLGKTTSQISEEHKTALANAISQFVIAKVAENPKASGVSIYYPLYNTKFFKKYGAHIITYSNMPENYRNFSMSLFNCATNSDFQQDHSISIDSNSIQGLDQGVASGNELTLQLSSDQLANLQDVTYTVLAKNSDKYGKSFYVPVMMECKVTPDEKGVVHLPEDPEIFEVGSETDAICLPAYETVNEEKSKTYVTKTILLSTDFGIETKYVKAVMNIKKEEGKAPEILAYAEQGSDANVVERTQTDFSKWKYIQVGYSKEYEPEPNISGQMLPYKEWSGSGDIWLDGVRMMDGWGVKAVKTSELSKEFAYQVLVTETDGTTYASEAIPIVGKDKASIETVATEQGTLTFSIYSDHAELTKYEGTDTKLELPGEVSGKTVTSISGFDFITAPTGGFPLQEVVIPEGVKSIMGNSFSACRSLTSVTFPESLIEIDVDAFDSAPIQDIKLPSHLERIENGAFNFYPSLMEDNLNQDMEVELPDSLKYLGGDTFARGANLTLGNNPNFVARDNAIFTADGTVLVRCLETGTEYTIPEGVTEIGYGAFASCNYLENVTYPGSLVKISEKAFKNQYKLKEIVIPDTVKDLGYRAFDLGGYQMEDPGIKIHIGKGLENIEEECFYTTKVSEIEVDPENQFFSVQDGCLIRQGELICTKTQEGGSLAIPEGVVVIADGGAFRHLSGLESVTLPDSLIFCNFSLYPSKKLNIGKGLNKCELPTGLDEITISPENRNFSMVDGIVYDGGTKELIVATQAAPSDLTLPKTVEKIDYNAFYKNNSITKIHLPASLASISEEEIQGYTSPQHPLNMIKNLESIEVDEANETYMSNDGLLYSKDGSKLLACPALKAGEVTLLDGTKEISFGATKYVNKITKLTLPESLVKISGSNFTFSLFNYERDKKLDLYLPDSLNFVAGSVFDCTDQNPDCLALVIIHAKDGSVGSEFAKQKGITVEPK